MVLGFNRPYAHPISSFNEPVLPPAVEPDEGEQVQVCFSVEWLPLVQGALAQLILQTTWLGDPDAVLLAQGRATNLRGLFANPVCSVPAPYWDDSDGDDSDDEAPSDDQPWYGVWDGETFAEAFSYWAVTAFLMTGISEGAAIEFITPLRQFRLLLRANPHGAKLLIFMDSNIFQLVDLFSATEDVVSVDIVSPGSTLMLVHTGEHNPSATPDANGDYVVQVLRKELSEVEVTPTNQRVNPDTNVFQISPDGGTTWNDAPGSDPRTSPAYFLPPLEPYDGIQCDVAARMTAQLKDTLTIFLESGEAAQSVTGWLALLVFPLGLVGWFVDVLLVIANVLIDIGQGNIEDAFTEAVYDDLECRFFCALDTDGRMTQEQLDAAYDEIESAHPGVVANVIAELRFFFGDVPMLNAGVVRDEEGDCSECDCDHCHEWSFLASEDGWNAFVTGGDVRAEWSAFYEGWITGTGGGTGYTQIEIPSFDTIACTRIQLFYPFGHYPDATRCAVRADDVSGAVYISAGDPGVVMIDGEVWLQFDVDETISGLWVTGDNSGGTQLLQKIRVRYTGDQAFGGDNC